jgi:hypothetical protein
MSDLNVDIDDIMAFEDGTISQDRKVTMFQHLVDTGHAWTLQGFYGREACQLIVAGLVKVEDFDRLPPMAQSHIRGLRESFNSMIRSR